MKIKFKEYLFLLLLVLLLPKMCFSQNISNFDPVTETYRIKLEEMLEERLKNRMVSLLQDKNIFIIVKVRLSGETSPIANEVDPEYALPGVPIEKNFAEKEEEIEINIKKYASVISGMHAWIFISREVPNESLEKAKLLSSEILGINAERGDTLSIETYFKESSLLNSLKNSDDIVKLATLVIFLFAAIIFLFGPLGIFLSKISKNMSSNRIQQVAAGVSGGFLPETQRAVLSNDREGSGPIGKGRKFSFINESNIEDLAVILSSSSTQDSVIVLNNLPIYLANKIFSKLPADQQRDIIEQQKKINFMQPDTVEIVEEKIENKINNIYGGVRKVSHLIQGCSQDVRKNLIEWLKQSDAGFASEIEGNIMEFEDLLNYSDLNFRRIFRAAGLQSFAQAVKSFDDEIISRFTAKLNPDIAVLINEQLKILPANKRKAEEEQIRILGMVEGLIKEGEIEPAGKREVS